MKTSENLEELITGFYDREVIAFSDSGWTLKSGRRSPLYYSQRKITSYNSSLEIDRTKQRRIRDLAVEAYARSIDVIPECDHVFGLPQAMTALGGAVMQLSGESMLWGRVGRKDHGIDAGEIEGDYVAGETVVMLDDVITTASSKLQATQLLEKNKLVTSAIVVMFDREEGGAEIVRESGSALVAITGLTQVMDVLRTNGRIGARETEWMSQYHEELKADDRML